MNPRPVRWGIMSTGNIARGFASDLRQAPGAELAAVGSRDAATAATFAREYGVARSHGTYEALVADPDVDIVYIGTPHGRHYEDALLALDAGKHVRCEKAFTLNARQAREVVQRARQRGLFCMEAMWTRFLPVVRRAREAALHGNIGELRAIEADFGYPAWPGDENRYWNPALGGGALLDVGVYPVSFAHWLFGPPQHVEATGTLSHTGVDADNRITLRWSDGRMATLTSSLAKRTPTTAAIIGTKGVVQIAAPFFNPPWFRVRHDPQARAITGLPPVLPTARKLLQRAARRSPPRMRSLLRMLAPVIGPTGYQHEAIEAMECVRAGRLESGIMPLDETVRVMELMDEIRRQIGVRYPRE
jgi:predicted dehydrogenase